MKSEIQSQFGLNLIGNSAYVVHMHPQYIVGIAVVVVKSTIKYLSNLLLQINSVCSLQSIDQCDLSPPASHPPPSLLCQIEIPRPR